MNLKRFKILPKRHQEAVKSAYELYQKEFGKEPTPKEFNMLMDGVVKKFPYDKEERAQEAKRDAARTLAGLGQGALSLVDLPFDAFDLAATGAQYAGHKLAPSYVSKPEGLGRFSPQISHKFRKYVDEKTGGLSEPVTEEEEYLDLGSQVLGGIASPGAVANVVSKGLKGAQATSQISSKLINAAEKTNDFLAQMGKWNKVNVGSSFGGAYAAHSAMQPKIDEEGNVIEQPGILKGLAAGLAGAIAGGTAPGAIQKVATQSPLKTFQEIKEAPKNVAAKMASSYSQFQPELYNKYKDIGNNISHFTSGKRGFKWWDKMRQSILSSDITQNAESLLQENLAKKMGLNDINQIHQTPNVDNVLVGAQKAKDKVRETYKQEAEQGEVLMNKRRNEKELIHVGDIMDLFKSGREGIFEDPPAKALFLRSPQGETLKLFEEGTEFQHKKRMEKIKKEKLEEVEAFNKSIDDELNPKIDKFQKKVKGYKFDDLSPQEEKLIRSEIEKYITPLKTKNSSFFDFSFKNDNFKKFIEDVEKKSKNKKSKNKNLPEENYIEYLNLMDEKLNSKKINPEQALSELDLTDKKEVSIAHLNLIEEELRKKLLDHTLSESAKKDLIKVKGEVSDALNDVIEDYLGNSEYFNQNALEKLKKARKNYSDESNDRIIGIKQPDGTTKYIEQKGTIPTANKFLKSSTKQEAFDSLFSSNDHREYATIYKGLNEDQAKQLTQDILARAAKTNKDEFSATKLASWFQKKNPQVQKEFLNLAFKDKDSRNNFKKTLEFLAEQQEKQKKWGNPSGSAYTISWDQALKEPGKVASSLAKALWKEGGTTWVKPAVGFAAIITKWLSSRAAAKYLSDPAFLERMNRVSLSKTPQQYKRRLKGLLKTAAPRITQKSLRAAKIPIEQKDDDEED